MRFFIDLAYCGKNYHGWQTQPNVISVQETVENALAVALQQRISLVGAGRTDAGVHARQLIAHFDFDKPIEGTQLAFKLNTILPFDIAVARVYEVHKDAHARFDACSREYNYYISTRKNPFTSDFSYYIKKELDFERMNQASKILIGKQDFKCFSKTKTDVKTYYCTIETAYWKKTEDQLVFTIKADRFLRNMVRAIVGTLIEIGLKKIEVSEMQEIIKSRDRGKAGKSVDAQGLFLEKIEYSTAIIKQ